ncbi:serine hydrolase [candidate division KSB1 bacterium]|nr:serine hydrolase [candidate division KSB1 bacterium]
MNVLISRIHLKLDVGLPAIILSILFLSVLCVLFLYCQPALEQRMERLFKPYSGNVPGASVMVIQDGIPVLIRTFGFAHLEKKIPVKAETNFRLASVSKQFTAMAVLLLMQEDQLDFSTPLTTIFPEFPEYGREITIGHLLHHQSGLLDYETLVPDTVSVQVKDHDVLAVMMQQDSLYFEPGTEYRYSNTGYAILAMVVQKISGQSFSEFLHERIFAPLDMKTTVAFEKDVNLVSNRAFGYRTTESGFEPRDQSAYSAVLGDGGIYSNVHDLFLWDQALYGNVLLDDKLMTKVFTPATLKDGTPTDYGCGWRIDTFMGHERVHHTGQTCGFTTVIQRYPQARTSILVLTNRDEPMVGDLADQISKLYLGDPS